MVTNAKLAIKLVNEAVEADYLKNVKHDGPTTMIITTLPCEVQGYRRLTRLRYLESKYLYLIDSNENLQASLDQVLHHKKAEKELALLEGKRRNKYESVHTTIGTNLKGETEIVLNSTETYVCHFQAPGYYPKGHPPLRIGVAIDDEEKRKRGLLTSHKESLHVLAISLMPKIQHVRVSLVDFESGSPMVPRECRLPLPYSGFKHISRTDKLGFAEFYVPIGRYEELLNCPNGACSVFYKDKLAMRFLDTAKALTRQEGKRLKCTMGSCIRRDARPGAYAWVAMAIPFHGV